MKLDELSVFFPFWNEEKNVERVVLSAIPIVKKYAKRWEILMVDDGSKDDTCRIAERLVAEYENLRLISHTPNRGYGAALREGFQNAKYKTIVFVDGDGQFDFSELPKFIEKIESSDIVIGYRKKRRDHKIFKRLLLMNMLKIWDLILFGFHFKDIDCGFKMFKKSALHAIGPLRSEGAMVTTEILAKATKRKLIITQVGVEHFQRKYGVQTGANIFVIIRAVLESFILWFDIKNARF